MGDKKKKVTRDLYNDPNVKSKRVVKKGRKGTTTTEKSDLSAYKESDKYTYNKKKLWKRRFKSKTNKEGEEVKRKEKIVFDDGKQMKKRKQRKVKFGPNKGKVLSKTVSWKDGKRSVKKEYLDKVSTDKLKKGGVKYRDGGFLESPIPFLFED